MLKRLIHTHPTRLYRNNEGATLVEFGILATVLFTLLIGMFEVGLLLFTEIVLEGATSAGARIGKTGFTPSGQTPEEYIISEIKRISGGLIDTSKLTIEMHAYNNFSNIGNGADCTPTDTTPCPYSDGTGTPGQVVLYRVKYPYTFYTPLIGKLLGNSQGTLTLTAVQTAKHEPQ